MNHESSGESEKPGGHVLRYLTRTHPAVIFVHAVILLLVGPFLNAAELWMQSSGVGYGDYLNMTLSGDRPGYAVDHEDRVNPLRSAVVWALRIGARIAITVGYALPFWAVARLIADALTGRLPRPAPAAEPAPPHHSAQEQDDER